MAGKTNPTTIKDVNTRVEKLASEFNDGLSMLKEEFLKLKKSITETKEDKEGNDFLQQLEKFQSGISDSLRELSNDMDKLKSCLSVTQSRVKSMELHRNAQCIVIHGIKEQNNSDMYSTAITLFHDKINIKVNKSDISYCYWLGRRDSTKKKPRPLVVQFCTRWRRDEMFNNKKRLKGTGIIITELLTQETLMLFKKAREAFDKRAWTFNGLVYIEVAGQRKLIKSEGDLSGFMD